MMHNVEPQQIIDELNEAIKKKADGGEQILYRLSRLSIRITLEIMF